MITAIFDLDGTLADTLEDLADAVNYGLSALGCPPHPLESFKQMVGDGASLLCWRALPEDRKELADELYKGFSSEYESRHLNKSRLYDGISETVAALRDAGVTLAVATNKPHDAAVKIIAGLLPDAGFITVLGSCADRPKKPDPTIIREILAGLPAEDNTVYMIGDSNVDVRTAKNAGIISIGCAWGFRGSAELIAENADFIAEKPQDIARIILGREE